MKKYLHVCGSISSGGIASFVKSMLLQNASFPTAHYAVILKNNPGEINKFVKDISKCRYNIIKALKFTSKASKEYQKIFIHSADYLVTLAFIIHRSDFYLFQHGMAVSNGSIIKRMLKKIWFSIIPFFLDAKIICSSDYALNKTRLKGVFLSPKRIQIIPFGTSLPRRIEANQKKNFNKIIMGTAGRLAAIKRFDILLQSLTDYQEDLEIELRIAGDGPEKDKLTNISGKIESPKVKIKFIGEVNNMSDFYDSLDIFIFPSHKESFGLVILESLYRNIPVAAFNDLGGALNLIEHKKSGFILKGEDKKNELQELWKYLSSDILILNKMSLDISKSDYTAYDIVTTRKKLEE